MNLYLKGIHVMRYRSVDERGSDASWPSRARGERGRGRPCCEVSSGRGYRALDESASMLKAYITCCALEEECGCQLGTAKSVLGSGPESPCMKSSLSRVTAHHREVVTTHACSCRVRMPHSHCDNTQKHSS